MKAKYTGRAPAARAMLAACLLPWMAHAQTSGPATSIVPGNARGTVASDALEQRRALERANLLRQQQEQAPDVQLQPAPAAPPQRLPVGETPCSRIDTVTLAGDDAGRFLWLLDAIAGNNNIITNDGAPQPQCLGVRGIEQVRQRAQDALNNRGYVTSRVLLQSQELASGTLTLTLLPGRIHAIRIAEPDSHRGTLWNAIPARAGDILNLRDIEQGLENFKRVPGVETDIAIAPAEDAAPGESDLVISYRQAQPLRLSVSADDSGTRATGRYQGAVTFSYDKWLTLNDLFYLSLNHDLGHNLGHHVNSGNADNHGTSGGTLHYSLPLGYWLLGTTVSRNR
ncbi:hypothetical protein BH11PSE7_BH11PSE7_30950 [soil metagenome]